MATIALNIGNSDKKYNLETYDGFIVEIPHVIIMTINLEKYDDKNNFEILYSYVIYKSDKDVDKFNVNASLPITTNFNKEIFELTDKSILEMCYDDIVRQIPQAEKVSDKKDE